MQVGKDRQRIVKIKDAKRLAGILSGTRAEGNSRKLILDVPEKAWIAFLALDESCILVYHVVHQRIIGSLGKHLVLKARSLKSQLLDEGSLWPL